MLNLAAGSFYALGAFLGVSAVGWAGDLGVPAHVLPVALVAAGASLGVLGLATERLLRTVRGRDEVFQLLLTFALVLMLEDATRLAWGPEPRSAASLYLVYGKVGLFGLPCPSTT